MPYCNEPNPDEPEYTCLQPAGHFPETLHCSTED